MQDTIGPEVKDLRELRASEGEAYGHKGRLKMTITRIY
jgi:hypothetical protein